MPDFELSPQQQNIRNMLHWFAAEKMRPLAIRCDREHTVPMDFLREVHGMGIGGASTMAAREERRAEEAGESEPDEDGIKQSNRIAIIGAEEMAWGCPAIMLTFPGPGLAGPPVRIMGTPEQQELFFSTYQGDDPEWGAYALSEPGAGSDVSAIQTTARKEGDHYVLNGTKTWITNGDRAEWVTVFATVDKKAGRAGHRCFLVRKGTPGFQVVRVEEKMGLRANGTAQLAFEECRVPADMLLGGEEYYERKVQGGGFKGAMKTFDQTRPMVAVMAVGIARAAWEETVRFFQDDSRAPQLRLTQRIHEELATLKRKIDAARLLCWQAAWMADAGVPNTKEASMSKAYAGNVVQEVTSRCVELMGLAGIVVDNYVEKCFRDQKVYDIFEGTGQVQRLVISRRLLTNLEGKIG